jgi:hypothetical protein
MAEARLRSKPMNNDGVATGFPNSWREVLNELQREWDRLHQEIAALRTERDQLAKALVALLREEVTLTEEQILAQLGQEKPLLEFLQEMRALLVEADVLPEYRLDYSKARPNRFAARLKREGTT